MATVPELAKLLDISTSTAYRWVRKGRVLAWMQGRQLMGPTEQIMGPRRPVPALEEVSAIIDMPPVLVWDFLHQPWPWAHGPPIPPFEKLRRGEVQEVLDAAPGYGSNMG
jgi:excisionase family DNA binding protein